jgi:hypothetical protein
VNGAVLALLRRLGVELGLPFNPAGSEARPCRAGQLYRVDLGGRPFALKLYVAHPRAFVKAWATDSLAAFAEGDASPIVHESQMFGAWAKAMELVLALSSARLCWRKCRGRTMRTTRWPAT